MSLLVIEALSEGIIFAADRNITLATIGKGTEQVERQAKVLKWPNNKAIIGYVGAANISEKTTEEWIKLFIEEFKEFSSFEEISEILSTRLTEIWKSKYSNYIVPGLLIHIGGFEKRNGYVIPTIWFIRNVHDMSIFEYKNSTLEFKYSDEFLNIYSKRFEKYYPGRKIYNDEIRKILKVWAKQYNRFWFHHGFDLVTFNVLQSSLESAFKLLVDNHPNHDFPSKIGMWEKHLRFQILMYGAYFEAFYEKGKHFVGGGVDVESIPWPE